MADEFLRSLAALTSLRHCPGQGPFGQKDGAVIGARNGYVVAAGPAKSNDQSAVGVMVRFRPTEQSATIHAAVAQNQSVLAALGASELSGKHAKQLEVGKDFLLYRWPYTFKKPAADSVAKLIEGLVESAKSASAALDGRCEVCGSSAPDIVLRNGIPGHYCTGCRQKAEVEGSAAEQEYSAAPANLPRGILFGVAAALVGAVAWGGVAYLLNRIFLWGAILIGLLIGYAVHTGMRKINAAGNVLAAVLTVASVMAGDMFFYALSAMKELELPFDASLQVVYAHFWELEMGQDGLFSTLFALGGVAYVLYKFRKPTFKPVFETLGQP